VCRRVFLATTRGAFVRLTEAVAPSDCFAFGSVYRFTLLLGGIAESDSTCCDRCYHRVVCPSVCLSVWLSVTLVHPAKAVGQNEMPFGRDTCVVQSNIILNRDRVPLTGRRDFGSEPPVKICIANCGQSITDSRVVTMDSI